MSRTSECDDEEIGLKFKDNILKNKEVSIQYVYQMTVSD